MGQALQVVSWLSQLRKTFELDPPETAGTVEVSVATMAAQGGILVADAAPGEFLLLCLLLRPRGDGPGLGVQRQGSQGEESPWYAGVCTRTQLPLEKEAGDVESAVSLTSDRALQDGTLGGRAVSMWVLKPLASSRAASSMSCGCKEKDLFHQATPGFGCSTLQEVLSNQLSNPEQRQGDWAWLGLGGRQSQGRVAHLLHDSVDSCLFVLLIIIREVVLEGY